jgi:hypothetical protein
MKQSTSIRLVIETMGGLKIQLSRCLVCYLSKGKEK